MADWINSEFLNTGAIWPWILLTRHVHIKIQYSFIYSHISKIYSEVMPDIISVPHSIMDINCNDNYSNNLSPDINYWDQSFAQALTSLEICAINQIQIQHQLAIYSINFNNLASQYTEHIFRYNWHYATNPSYHYCIRTIFVNESSKIHGLQITQEHLCSQKALSPKYNGNVTSKLITSIARTTSHGIRPTGNI